MSEAPVAPPVPYTEHHHGHPRSDPWRWLDDIASPEALALIAANNEHTLAATRHLDTSRASERLRDWTPRASASLPVGKGGWDYYTRAAGGSDFGVRCRRPAGAAGGEQVVLDEARLAAGRSYYALGGYDVSPDGRLLAYAVDHTGEERHLLRFRDIATGADLPVQVEDVSYGGAWDAGATTYFHLTADGTGRTDRLWRVRLDTGERALVLAEPDGASWLSVGLSRSERFVLVESASHDGNGFSAIDAAAPESAPFALGPPRRPGARVTVDHGEGHFWVLEAGRLWRCPVADPTSMSEVEAGRGAVTVDAFAGHVVLQTLSPGRRGLLVIGGDGSVSDVDTGADWVSLTGNPDFGTRVVRFAASSVACPPVTAEYDLASGSTRALQRIELPGWDPGRYERLDVTAKGEDGTPVPMTVVRRKGSPSRGAVLEVYGAYGEVVPLTFDPARLPLLAEGVAYAFAHVRGGGERPGWHDAGRRERKAAGVSDFLACAEALSAQCGVPEGRVVAVAESAGAVIAAAALHRASGYFAGMVLDVPYLDPLGTLLDPGAALTSLDREEWGDPLAEPGVYAAMADYSPYDTIPARDLPPVLVFAALRDGRVGAHEALKYVSRLRAEAGGGPFLLWTDLESGHAGSSDRDVRRWRTALICAWTLDALDRTDGGAHGTQEH